VCGCTGDAALVLARELTLRQLCWRGVQVAFLTELPAMRGLSNAYLKSLSHCFHQVCVTAVT
jgi:hypothetical protein